MDRDSIVARYRHLRQIVRAHNSAVLASLPRRAIFDHARLLGLLAGKTIVAENDGELGLIFDLAIHSPRHTRSRAFERYRHSAKLPADSEEARVLDALCRTHFAVCRIERRHAVAGLVAFDLMRDRELWLMDLSMEATVPDGFVIAAHLVTLDGFSMTTGMMVPVNRDDLEDALDDMPARRADAPEALVDDPLFAGLIWRAALARGAMENVKFA
jgi:hypothetical protein